MHLDIWKLSWADGKAYRRQLSMVFPTLCDLNLTRQTGNEPYIGCWGLCFLVIMRRIVDNKFSVIEVWEKRLSSWIRETLRRYELTVRLTSLADPSLFGAASVSWEYLFLQDEYQEGTFQVQPSKTCQVQKMDLRSPYTLSLTRNSGSPARRAISQTHTKKPLRRRDFISFEI